MTNLAATAMARATAIVLHHHALKKSTSLATVVAVAVAVSLDTAYDYKRKDCQVPFFKVKLILPMSLGMQGTRLK